MQRPGGNRRGGTSESVDGSQTAPGIERGTFSIEEAAQRLGLSTKATRKAAKAGQFPSIRIGRRLLIPREAFEAWLRSPTAVQSDAPMRDAEATFRPGSTRRRRRTGTTT